MKQKTETKTPAKQDQGDTARHEQRTYSTRRGREKQSQGQRGANQAPEESK